MLRLFWPPMQPCQIGNLARFVWHDLVDEGKLVLSNLSRKSGIRC